MPRRFRVEYQPWTEQPQYAALPESRWATGLRTAWIGSAPLLDAYGAPYALVSSPPPTSTRAGVGPGLNGSTGSVNTQLKITAAQGTILLYSDLGTVSNRTFSQATDNAGSGDAVSLVGNNFTINGSAISLFSLSAGVHGIACSWGGSGPHKGSYDGRPASEYGPSGGTPTAPAGAYYFEIGAFSFSGGRISRTQQTPLLFAYWERILSQVEQNSLTANPWQLFAPRRIIIPVSAVGGGGVALSGQSAAASAGVVLSSRSIALLGQSASVVAGSTVATSSLGVAGQSVAATQGSAASAATIVLGGQAVTVTAGTITPSTRLAGAAVAAQTGAASPQAAVQLSGASVAAAAGTITYSPNTDLSVAASGQSASASAGTLAPSRTVTLSGQVVTAAPGTVVANTDGSVTLAVTGEQIVVAAGALAASRTVALSGQAVVASTGAVAPSLSRGVVSSSVALSQGAFSLSITGAMSGSAAAALAGSLAASGGEVSASAVWSYVLSNGMTAEDTLIAIHTMTRELHRIHGLEIGSPLEVTSTARTSGAIVQAITELAGVVRVTRTA